MSPITVTVLIFSLLGAFDLLIGNKIGIGREFEKAFSLFGPLALSMIGMLVIAPAVGVWLTPFFDGFYSVFKIDPSVLPASILAIDMGGMTLAQSVCKDASVGGFNAFIVSSMMGTVISFTLPFALGVVKKEQYGELFLGILCGIATLPIGCFVAGLVLGIGLTTLLLTLLPLIVIAGIILLALVFFKEASIKCFAVFGYIIKTVSLIGFVCGIFTFLTKIVIVPEFDSFENAAFVCANACVTLSGTLPLMFILTKALGRTLGRLGSRIGINDVSTVALLGTLVTNATTFGVMEKMDKKGTVINSAFIVSASFTVGGQLAFAMVYDGSYVPYMMLGKVVSGICAVILALFIYKKEDQIAE